MGVAGSFTTDLDPARTPLDVSPIPPAMTRAAMLHLLGAFCATHSRMPSEQAVREVWSMLADPPRAEVPAAALRARGLPDARERVSDR